jgi:hypothetical protein
MKNKWLYTFTIDREVEKKVTEKQKDEKGEEIEVTKTVKESAPATFHLKKPNRKLYDKAELFYGVRMSEGIKAGLLTRNLLAKRYEDDGGAFSEKEKERYSELYTAIYNKENEYQRLQVNLDNKSQELKDSISEQLLGELGEMRRELVEIENSQSNIFDQTAENRAKNQTIMWWVLQLSQWQEHEALDPKPFFSGKNYDERLESYDEYEDSDDEFLNESIRKLAFFVSFWYMGRAGSEEDFKAVEELYVSQNEPASENEEEISDDVDDVEEVEVKATKKKKAKKKPAKKATKKKNTKAEASEVEDLSDAIPNAEDAKDESPKEEATTPVAEVSEGVSAETQTKDIKNQDNE